jgi:hypothetical protein
MASTRDELVSIPVADQLEIHATLVRYSMGIDDKNWDVFASCFTDNCHARYGDLEYGDRDALTQAFIAIHAQLDSSMHRVLNFAILDYDGDQAHTRSYCDAIMIRSDTADGDKLQVIGRYEDELVRSESGWLIHRRHFIAVHYEGNIEVLPAEIAKAGYSDA